MEFKRLQLPENDTRIITESIYDPGNIFKYYLVELLLLVGVCVSLNYKLLKWAGIHGNIAVIVAILQDPSIDGRYPLIWASQYGQVAVVDCLLQNVRIDPTGFNNAALEYAKNANQHQVVARLLQDQRIVGYN